LETSATVEYYHAHLHCEYAKISTQGYTAVSWLLLRCWMVLPLRQAAAALAMLTMLAAGP
jgi:hypothetical protein